jgi:hypothetical protein
MQSTSFLQRTIEINSERDLSLARRRNNFFFLISWSFGNGFLVLANKTRVEFSMTLRVPLKPAGRSVAQLTSRLPHQCSERLSRSQSKLSAQPVRSPVLYLCELFRHCLPRSKEAELCKRQSRLGRDLEALRLFTWYPFRPDLKTRFNALNFANLRRVVCDSVFLLKSVAKDWQQLFLRTKGLHLELIPNCHARILPNAWCARLSSLLPI